MELFVPFEEIEKWTLEQCVDVLRAYGIISPPRTREGCINRIKYLLITLGTPIVAGVQTKMLTPGFKKQLEKEEQYLADSEKILERMEEK